jgi:hypothetical protein
LFKKEVGRVFVMLSLNGHGDTMVTVEDIELCSHRIDLSKLSQSELEALKCGVKETLQKEALGCFSAAGLRTRFSARSPLIRQDV